MEQNIIHNTDCLEGLKRLPNDSIDSCVTSPPYYRLRDYGMNGQIGLEETPEDYIQRLKAVFTEVLRVLKPSGTLWLNIGDSYATSGKGFGGKQNHPGQGRNKNRALAWQGIKAKDLIGIPWMLAFELRLSGWYLRQDIIWVKPNAMPESVKDRCSKSHEHVFLLAKSAHYYFDNEAIKRPAKNKENRPSGIVRDRECKYHSKPNIHPGAYRVGGAKRKLLAPSDPSQRKNTSRIFTPAERVNKRDVWEIPTTPSKDAHFAPFPAALIVDCIKAGTPEGGLVLDPFMGSGTTAMVARRLGRNYIGYELNPEYIEISKKNIDNHLGIFK